MAVQDPTVDLLLDEAVAQIHGTSSGVVLRQAAVTVVERARLLNPDLLVSEFEEHMVTWVAERIRHRLARERTRVRQAHGVFGHLDPAAPPPTTSPFQIRYAGREYVWKPAALMLRPDWAAVATNRAALAKRSLFEVALAKRMVKALPDDHTPTGEVLTEDQFVALEREAEATATKVLETLP